MKHRALVRFSFLFFSFLFGGGETLGQKAWCTLGPLQVLFFGKPWVKKRGVLWGSSPSTISGSLWISPNWTEITCNFLALGWCNKSTPKKKKKKPPTLWYQPFLHIFFQIQTTSKFNSLCMLHTSQC
jgi:hypothetical protein